MGGRNQGEQMVGAQQRALAEQGIRRHLQGGASGARPGQALRPPDQVQRTRRERSGRHSRDLPSRRLRRQEQARGGIERLGLQYLGYCQLVHGKLTIGACISWYLWLPMVGIPRPGVSPAWLASTVSSRFARWRAWPNVADWTPC